MDGAALKVTVIAVNTAAVNNFFIFYPQICFCFTA
jgi:hypothetical protein